MTHCSTLPTTCPMSTDGRWIAIVRKRAMMPSVMSLETDTAVPMVVLPMVISSRPGTRYAMYAERSGPPPPPMPALIVSPKM